MDNRLLAFAKLALAVAQRVLPKHAHKFSPKTYTPRAAASPPSAGAPPGVAPCGQECLLQVGPTRGFPVRRVAR